ncbi:neo-calmodulin-like [Oculina patagonica]
MAGKSYFNADVPEIVVKSLFQKYDTDGSGRLAKKEVLILLKDDLGMKDDQAQACYMLVDKDGGGDLSFDEFIGWLRSEQGFKNIDNSSRYYYIQKAIAEFKKYDKDGNGTIDKDEFKSLMTSLGNKDESTFDSALRSLDTSGDGKISFPEFLAWLNWLPAN